MIKINITTLGCPKNVVDSDHLMGSFATEGFVLVDNPEDANILIVNTCGFIKDAKEESIEEILRLAELKKGQGIKENARCKMQNAKFLIVFGCLAKRYKDELQREIPEIDGMFGVGEEKEIVEYCNIVSSKQYEVSSNKKFPTAYSLLPTKNSYAYLKIAEGCDKKCTFCVIPSIRGRFRSFSPEDILKEAEEYIHKGVKELILVAQDITRYGKEFRGYKLVSLLRDLTSINGDFHIRLLYLYPAEINDELIEFVAVNNKIFKYLDIPLQHSEDRLLRLMGRRGTRKEYIKLIKNIRRNIPGVALRTTFIVGFPTETEEDFNGLIDFVEEIGFDRLGVFKYSKEDGTPASKLKGQVPEKLKNRRYDEIMKRQALISLVKNKELIGKRFSAIVDEVDKDITIARLYSQAPEIDGVVIIQSTEPRAQNTDKKNLTSNSCSPSFVRVGDIVTVEIVDAYDYDLKGVVVNR